MTEAFGEELRRWRERAGFSLATLASQVHYTKGHLSNVENGRKHATTELAERCDAVLGADGHLIELLRAQPSTTALNRSLKPGQLPAGISYFVGRATAIAQLDSLFASSASPVIAIEGMPGVGKTALTIRWAHDRSDRFPDGVLFADLRGHGPEDPAATPDETLDQFLRALNPPGTPIPDTLTAKTSLFRSLLHGRRTLIVLDNAATSDQVRPLLPGSPGCLVLVTSRNRLSGLAVREGATRLTLHPLRPAEAISLLRTIIGSNRTDAEPDAAGAVAARCAYLPLALRIAAERAVLRPDSTLAELADALADQRDRLSVLTVDNDESSALRTVFSWSYRTLSADSARMFRHLSLHPGPDITPPAAAALLDTTTSETTHALDQLTSAHLADEHASCRYRLSPLLRTYAAERFDAEEPPPARTDAVTRVLTWYLHTAATAARAIGPHQRHLALPHAPGLPQSPPFSDHRAALAWCDAELDNLLAAVDAATANQLDSLTWQLPLTLSSYFDHRKAWQPWITTHHLGLSAARRQGVRVAEAWLLTNLAAAYHDLGRLDEARDLLEESLAIQRETGDLRGEAHSLMHLGRTLTAQNRLDNALAQLLAALQILPDIPDPHAEATTLLEIAAVYRKAHQHHHAREPIETALTIFRRLPDHRGEASALTSLATTYHALGYPNEAVTEFDHALEAWRDADDHYGQAITLDRQGQVLDELDHTETADTAWRQALTIFERLGHPHAPQLRARLHKPGAPMTRPDNEAC